MLRARALVGLLIAATVVPLHASPAGAAPPTNDTSGSAVIASIGFTEEVDTTEATTDGEDSQLNETCGAPATDASVWYTLTTAADSGVVVDVSESSYSAGVLVGVGSPGSLETVTCGPGTVGFAAVAGTTYHVLAIDDQEDGGGNGGTLRISFNDAPEPPTVDLTVDPVGRVNTKTGVATLTGTYSCTGADWIELYGDARQPVGRFVVSGWFAFFDEGTCDGSARSWTADIYPENGKFAGGKALTFAVAYACGAFECAEGYTEQTVRLRGGG